MLHVIRHTTTYSHRADVSSGRCVLHLLPADAGRQRVLSATLTIDPAPAEQAEAWTLFGNRTSHVRFSRPAARRRFQIAGQVEVGAFEAPHALLTPAWESVRREALATADIATAAPAPQLFASRYVPLLDAARAYARESFTPGRPVLDARGGADAAHPCRISSTSPARPTSPRRSPRWPSAATASARTSPIG